LNEGYHWRIDNGSLISKWHTPWLRNEEDPTIFNNENLPKVSDLNDVNQCGWNRKLCG
jgi:hypothetical protein